MYDYGLKRTYDINSERYIFQLPRASAHSGVIGYGKTLHRLVHSNKGWWNIEGSEDIHTVLTVWCLIILEGCSSWTKSVARHFFKSDSQAVKYVKTYLQKVLITACNWSDRVLFRHGRAPLFCFNPLTPNDPYRCRTTQLTTSFILYVYSTNVGTEYFKRGIYSPFFSLQNGVCFIILTYLVPVLLTFYIQGVLKLKKIIPAPKG